MHRCTIVSPYQCSWTFIDYNFYPIICHSTFGLLSHPGYYTKHGSEHRCAYIFSDNDFMFVKYLLILSYLLILPRSRIDELYRCSILTFLRILNHFLRIWTRGQSHLWMRFFIPTLPSNLLFPIFSIYPSSLMWDYISGHFDIYSSERKCWWTLLHIPIIHENTYYPRKISQRVNKYQMFWLICGILKKSGGNRQNRIMTRS